MRLNRPRTTTETVEESPPGHRSSVFGLGLAPGAHSSLITHHFSELISAHQRRDLRLRDRGSDLKFVTYRGNFQIV